MGQQSSRIYIPGIGDHKDIYFNGKYHDKMYIGSQLVWEKQSAVSIGKMISIGGVYAGYALINPSEKIKYTIDLFGSPVTNATVLAYYETNSDNTLVTFYKICDVDKTDTYFCLYGRTSDTCYLVGHRGYYDIKSENNATFIAFSEELPVSYHLTGIVSEGFCIGDCLVKYDGAVTHATIKNFHDSSKWSPFYSENPELIKQYNVDIIAPITNGYVAFCDYDRNDKYNTSDYGYHKSLVTFAATSFSQLVSSIGNGLNYIYEEGTPADSKFVPTGIIGHGTNEGDIIFSNEIETFSLRPNSMATNGVGFVFNINYDVDLSCRDLDLFSVSDNVLDSYINNNTLYLDGDENKSVSLNGIYDVLYSARVRWYNSGFFFGNASDLYYVPSGKYENITKVSTIYRG